VHKVAGLDENFRLVFRSPIPIPFNKKSQSFKAYFEQKQTKIIEQFLKSRNLTGGHFPI